MDSIGDEKKSWIETKKKLAAEKVSLIGDMIFSSSFVNYLGPYEGSYRIRIV